MRQRWTVETETGRLNEHGTPLVLTLLPTPTIAHTCCRRPEILGSVTVQSRGGRMLPQTLDTRLRGYDGAVCRRPEILGSVTVRVEGTMLLRPWIPAFAGMTGLSVAVQRFWARTVFRVEGPNAPQTLDTRLRGYDGAVCRRPEILGSVTVQSRGDECSSDLGYPPSRV